MLVWWSGDILDYCPALLSFCRKDFVDHRDFGYSSRHWWHGRTLRSKSVVCSQRYQLVAHISLEKRWSPWIPWIKFTHSQPAPEHALSRSLCIRRHNVIYFAHGSVVQTAAKSKKLHAQLKTTEKVHLKTKRSFRVAIAIGYFSFDVVSLVCERRSIFWSTYFKWLRKELQELYRKRSITKKH